MRILLAIGLVAAPLLLSLALGSCSVDPGNKPWPVPEDAKQLKNPVPATEASFEAAKSIYQERCAPCHGDRGRGDGPQVVLYSVKPPDFGDAGALPAMSDGEIFWKISEGRRPMPSYKKRLTAEQRWELVNYLRTLLPKPVQQVGSGISPTPKSDKPRASNSAAPPKRAP